MLRHYGSVLVAAACVLGPATARADLPPPDGTKFVGYGFKVDNLAAFPEFTVFAFPWSLSNGAPTTEHAALEDGKVQDVGRRSPSPALYAMPKKAYDEWSKSYDAQKDEEGAELQKLVTRADVIKCSGAPTPRFSLPSSDSRKAIIETLRATKIDAKTCTLATALSPQKEEPSPSPSPEPDPAPSPPAPPPVAPEAAPKGKNGCGSCAVGAPSSDEAGFGLLGFGLLVLARRGRRR